MEETISPCVKNKRVLVTGACGFIGINLINELLRGGSIIIALDRKSADWSNISKAVTCVKVDILNTEELRSALDFGNIEIIYHLAARTDLDGKGLDDYRVNFQGTVNVIEAIPTRNKIQRFVYYSTQLVVGLFNETRFINENEPYRTKTFYGESKIKGEKMVQEFCQKKNIFYTIIRPTSVYGPWGKEPYRSFFQVIKKRSYFHLGKASNLVSWVYVKNLVNLTILCSLAKDARDEIFFGNDFHPYTMREIVEEVASYYKIKILTVPSILVTIIAYGFGVFKLFGIKVPIYPFRLRNIKSNSCFDIQKSVNLGYTPQYNLKRGIRETLDWYEKNP